MQYLLTSKSTLSPSGIFGALGLEKMKVKSILVPSMRFALSDKLLRTTHVVLYRSTEIGCSAVKEYLIDNSTYLNFGFSSVVNNKIKKGEGYVTWLEMF